MDFGVASVGVITVISYMIGIIVKNIPKVRNNLIPVICGLSGGVLGLVSMFINMPDFPAKDPLSAVAIGIVSGLAATGINQIPKQIVEMNTSNSEDDESVK